MAVIDIVAGCLECVVSGEKVVLRLVEASPESRISISSHYGIVCWAV